MRPYLTQENIERVCGTASGSNIARDQFTPENRSWEPKAIVQTLMPALSPFWRARVPCRKLSEPAVKTEGTIPGKIKIQSPAKMILPRNELALKQC